jgi:hypothetical protein
MKYVTIVNDGRAFGPYPSRSKATQQAAAYVEMGGNARVAAYTPAMKKALKRAIASRRRVASAQLIASLRVR